MTNTEIVRGFTEAINNNEFDRVWEFCSKDCISHSPPWVGLGFRPDLDLEGHFIIQGLIPEGNAVKAMQIGDEVLRVADEHRAWETYEEIKNGIWGQGIPGSAVLVTVKRGEQILDLRIERCFLPAVDVLLADFLPMWQADQLKNWIGLKSEIQLIFEKDDLVAFYAVDTGTNKDFQRTAAWGECNIFRIKDGKITEMWGVMDSYMQLTQLGYQITEPYPVLAL
jgi:predicted ester cyclase